MPLPFDYEDALWKHSGLKGWKLTHGNPANLVPGETIIFSVHPLPHDVHEGIFTIDAEGNVSMTINGRLMIQAVELPYMKFLYAGHSEEDEEGIRAFMSV